MRLKIGYPDPVAERELLINSEERAGIDDLKQCLDASDIKTLHNSINEVQATDSLLDYLQRLVAYTRQDDKFTFGLSPRGAIALIRSAKTWALMNERKHVLPEDVQMVLPAVTDHRLRAVSDSSGRHAEEYSQRLMAEVDIVAD